MTLDVKTCVGRAWRNLLLPSSLRATSERRPISRFLSFKPALTPLAASISFVMAGGGRHPALASFVGISEHIFRQRLGCRRNLWACGSLWSRYLLLTEDNKAWRSSSPGMDG
jgi:hypothetical protein